MEKIDNSFFKRKVNRICIAIDGYGIIPLATSEDDIPEFLTSPPESVGDEAVLLAEGKARKVILAKGRLGDKYLVDLGPEHIIGKLRVDYDAASKYSPK